jgi:hypothetical protein
VFGNAPRKFATTSLKFRLGAGAGEAETGNVRWGASSAHQPEKWAIRLSAELGLLSKSGMASLKIVRQKVNVGQVRPSEQSWNMSARSAVSQFPGPQARVVVKQFKNLARRHTEAIDSKAQLVWPGKC